jgi:hypothetical protein
VQTQQPVKAEIIEPREKAGEKTGGVIQSIDKFVEGKMPENNKKKMPGKKIDWKSW